MSAGARHDLDEIGYWARAIVLRRVAILAILPTLVSVGAAFGVPSGVALRITGGATAGLTFLAAIVGALLAQNATTPADIALRPVSASGSPLVELASVTAPLAEAITAGTDDLSDMTGGGVVGPAPVASA